MSNNKLSRRNVLRTATMASGGLLAGVPSLSIASDATLPGIDKSEVRLVTLSVETESNPTNTPLIAGGIDWPEYLPIQSTNPGEQAAVFLPNYRNQEDYLDKNNDIVAISSQKTNAFSNEKKIQHSFLPVTDNPQGSGTYIESMRSPEISVKSTTHGVKVSSLGESRVVADQSTGRYSVGMQNEIVENSIEVTISCNNFGKVNAFGHRNGVLLPKTEEYEPLVKLVKTGEGNEGRKYHKYEIDEMSEISAFALTPEGM